MEPTHETGLPMSDLPMPVGVSHNTQPESGERAVQSETYPSVQTPSTNAQVASSSPISTTTVASGAQGDSAVPVMTDDATMIADDAELIEKEWIIRAKAVVEQTKIDPHMQNRELSKVKAEYIKKRYNKDVKVSED